jgi:hypothetical protein
MPPFYSPGKTNTPHATPDPNFEQPPTPPTATNTPKRNTRSFGDAEAQTQTRNTRSFGDAEAQPQTHGPAPRTPTRKDQPLSFAEFVEQAQNQIRQSKRKPSPDTDDVDDNKGAPNEKRGRYSK